MYIPIILGTAREGRYSEKVAKFMLAEARKAGMESEIIDVRNFKIEATDNTGESSHAKKFAEIIERASGLVIVSPEYNHGYPGELKMMLDMVYREYFHKPVGFCGVSIGAFGGVRAVEQLRQVVIEMRMIPIREAIYFPNVAELFDGSGNMKDRSYLEKAKLFLEELVGYAEKIGKK